MATAQQQIRDLKDEVKELSALVEKQARAVSKEAGNGHIHLTREDIREMAENAGVRTRRFFKDTRKQAQDAAGRYEDTVSAHPWKSTAIALTGGLLLGALLRRR
jgi:ElaB/YqjD/DUF883 family membrane-anchored ribosome-binding protein